MNRKPMLIFLTKLIPILWGAAVSAPLLYLIKNTDIRQIVDNIWKTISELNPKLEQFINKTQDNLLDIINKIQDNPLNIINKIQEYFLDNKSKYSNSIDNMNSFMTNFPSISDFLQLCKNWNLFEKGLLKILFNQLYFSYFNCSFII